MDKPDNIVFLGTGAAQGAPAAYSPRMASSVSDPRDVRSRSSLRVGTKHQIDAGPDAWYQLQREKQSWDALEHLFVSHTHSDHWYLDGVLQKQDAADHDRKQLRVYLSAPALDWTLRTRHYAQTLVAPDDGQLRDLRTRLEPQISFHVMEFREMYTVGDMQVCAIPGTHTGRVRTDVAMNYVMELPGGFRLLYGVDTGFYAEETIEFLSNTRLDLIVLDCTFGARTDRGSRPTGHLDCHSLVRLIERLDQAGCLASHSSIYATHINPDQGWTHAQMDSFFSKSGYPIRTAWDGLRIGTELSLS